MRAATRMLAAVKPTRYIEPGLPTGLTGLRSSTSPRSSLLYLYNATLSKLQQAPLSSLYRQSTETMIKHRLSVTESVVPAGWDEWATATNELLGQYKDQLDQGVFTIGGARAAVFERGGRFFIARQMQPPYELEDVEWDGEGDEGPELEGSRTMEERDEQLVWIKRKDRIMGDIRGWTPEPQLTADQIAEIEDKIGSGLIEELIQVAEGELKLAAVMVDSKAWESLEEKPAEGQWTYFERQG